MNWARRCASIGGNSVFVADPQNPGCRLPPDRALAVSTSRAARQGARCREPRGANAFERHARRWLPRHARASPPPHRRHARARRRPRRRRARSPTGVAAAQVCAHVPERSRRARLPRRRWLDAGRARGRAPARAPADDAPRRAAHAHGRRGAAGRAAAARRAPRPTLPRPPKAEPRGPRPSPSARPRPRPRPRGARTRLTRRGLPSCCARRHGRGARAAEARRRCSDRAGRCGAPRLRRRRERVAALWSASKCSSVSRVEVAGRRAGAAPLDEAVLVPRARRFDFPGVRLERALRRDVRRRRARRGCVARCAALAPSPAALPWRAVSSCAGTKRAPRRPPSRRRADFRCAGGDPAAVSSSVHTEAGGSSSTARRCRAAALREVALSCSCARAARGCAASGRAAAHFPRVSVAPVVCARVGVSQVTVTRHRRGPSSPVLTKPCGRRRPRGWRIGGRGGIAGRAPRKALCVCSFPILTSTGWLFSPPHVRRLDASVAARRAIGWPGGRGIRAASPFTASKFPGRRSVSHGGAIIWRAPANMPLRRTDAPCAFPRFAKGRRSPTPTASRAFGVWGEAINLSSDGRDGRRAESGGPANTLHGAVPKVLRARARCGAGAHPRIHGAGLRRSPARVAASSWQRAALNADRARARARELRCRTRAGARPRRRVSRGS